jgi:TFIIF-interacting CTD phosphatase-like protein
MPVRQIVFDLDETLIHYPGSLDVQMAIKRGLEVFILGDGTPIILRPGFYSFLSFVRAYFDRIYVFTAASELYAREVVDVIFAGKRPQEIWTQTSCRFVADGVIKPLRGKIAPDGQDLDNPYTIMIDDRPEVTGDNVCVRGGNHFVVSRFLGSEDDVELANLMSRIKAWISAPQQAN